jgi:hypothetical protein
MQRAVGPTSDSFAWNLEGIKLQNGIGTGVLFDVGNGQHNGLGTGVLVGVGNGQHNGLGAGGLVGVGDGQHDGLGVEGDGAGEWWTRSRLKTMFLFFFS